MQLRRVFSGQIHLMVTKKVRMGVVLKLTLAERKLLEDVYIKLNIESYMYILFSIHTVHTTHCHINMAKRMLVNTDVNKNNKILKLFPVVLDVEDIHLKLNSHYAC